MVSPLMLLENEKYDLLQQLPYLSTNDAKGRIQRLTVIDSYLEKWYKKYGTNGSI